MNLLTNERGRRFLQGCITLLCLLAWVTAMDISAVAEELQLETPDIEVVGLFKHTAVFRIDGKQKMLRVGGDPVAGIVLISADSESAVIEFDGQRQTLFLSERVAGAFIKPEKITVSIQLNNQKQYMTTGSINGVPVSFLVDTGATLIAMNSGMAKKLGIAYESAKSGKVITAGGSVKSWRVVLSSVHVGGIRRENVGAAVLEGDYPLDILLGMTFLHNVRMEESDGILVLSSKF